MPKIMLPPWDQDPETSTAPGPEGSGKTHARVPFELGHRPVLDGVRGVAILAVLCYHAGILQPAPHLPGGFLGVDLFFVLSGFLITALLLQERTRTGSIHLGQFYLRRGLRLLPALGAVLLGCWLLTLAWGATAERALLSKDIRSTLLYYHNWRVGLRTAGCGPYLLHCWSLAVEEQFYLVWPATLCGLLALRVRRRWVMGLVALGIVLPALLRLFLFTDNASTTRLYHCTDTRMDGLWAGSLLALCASFQLGKGVRPPKDKGSDPFSGSGTALKVAGWLALAILALHYQRCSINTPYLYRGGFTVVVLCTVVVLAALLWSPPRLLAWLLSSRPLIWLGHISYGAYLWNLPMIHVVARFKDRLSPLWIFALVIGGSIAAGAISHYCLEKPFLKLKAYLTPARISGRHSAMPLSRAA